MQGSGGLSFLLWALFLSGLRVCRGFLSGLCLTYRAFLDEVLG